jgi:hypothetical protein
VPEPSTAVPVYLERGKSRVIAAAVAWPGWCRSARDQERALEALAAYRDRYAAAIRAGARIPRSPDLEVDEILQGDAGTDFGTPSIVPAADLMPFDAAAFAAASKILEACWRSFDRTVEAAEGRELRKGPRGGGRDLNAIVAHVLGAEGSYLGRVAARGPKVDPGRPGAAAAPMRAAVREALDRAMTDGLPEHGPRGGKIWPVPFFIRRDAWHVLDHAWEIEDRASRRRV